MDTISVILPVYNAEGTLERCLKSLLTQQTVGGGKSFDYQIFAVNDGSTDRSGEILNEFALHHNRLIVLDKKNGGPASARKYAIDKSQSDFIAFCDSDDYVEPDWLEKLYKYLQIHNADISICGAWCNNYSSSKKYTEPYDVWIWNREQAYHKFLEHIHLNGVMCTNLFKRHLFDGLEWNFKMRFGEDAYLMWQILGKTDRIVKILVPKYHYVFNPHSLTNKSYSQSRFYSTKILMTKIVSDCNTEDMHYLYDEARDLEYRWIYLNLYACISSDYRDKKAESYMADILRRGGIKRLFRNFKDLRNRIQICSLMISPAMTRHTMNYIRTIINKN